MTTSPFEHNMKQRELNCLNGRCKEYRKPVITKDINVFCKSCGSVMFTIVKSLIDELVKRDSESA